MRHRNTLLLFAAALGLGVYVLFIDRPPAPPVRAGLDRVIGGFREDEVAALGIEAGGRRVRIERRGAGPESPWELVEPPLGRADRETVAQILSGVRFLQVRGHVSAEEAQAAGEANFGLDRPAAVLVCRSGVGALELAFGAANPAQADEVFLRVGGLPGLYSVPKDLPALLARDPGEFQDRALFGFDPARVDGLVLTLAREEIVLAKSGGEWRFEKPDAIRGPADPRATTALLENLRRLRWAERVEDKPADPARYGLAADGRRFTVTVSAARTTETVLVGSGAKDDDSRAYVRRGADGPVVRVDAALIAALPKKAEDLRLRRLFDAAPESVAAVEIEAGGEAAAVERGEGGTWRAVRPAGAAADADEIAAFLAGLAEFEIVNFYERTPADPATYGLDRPDARLALTTVQRMSATVGEGEQRQTKTVEKRETRAWRLVAKAGTVFLQQEGVPEVVEVERRLLDRLRLGSLNFRPPALVGATPDDIVTVAVERTERGAAGYVRYAVEREGDRWALKEPAGRAADAQAVLGAAGTLAGLTAASWAAAGGNDPGWGLDHPSVTVSFVFRRRRDAPPGRPEPAAEIVRRTLRIGAPAAGGRSHFARFDDDPAVFTLDARIVQKLDVPLAK